MRVHLTIGLLLVTLALGAQDRIYHTPDTTSEENYRYYIDLTKKPDAIKAVWLGTIFPGAGQIYNKSYWKLPIVYGAFMGCGYAISWTQNRYSNYKTAYLDLYNDSQAGTVSEDPGKSYIAVLPNGYDLSRVGGSGTWMNTLKNRQSTFRRYRDYSILAIIVAYALSLIDAYVDAQLFDYDISPDLTLNVEPQIYYDLQHQQQSAELKLAIQF
ncbi:MAG: hypothetical protein IJP45_04175 [Paludibacteraceae bacterium]|nr:hypothetical protein [Paludibacteraceae bacterium]MBQ6764369.1 hypothetical protein [Paludibacteraceae bacterium]MBR0065644.1 hypothetical protein [Paludibacteraceae bacterium]